jgi:simple sugar transport system permease protein
MSELVEATNLRYQRQSRWKRALTDYPGVISIAVFVAAVAVVFSLITQNFLSVHNFLTILRQAAPLCIVAVAVTFVVTTGGVDLSVGSVGCVAGVVTSSVISHFGIPVIPSMVLGLAVGGMIGFTHGYLVAFRGIPPFIVTLTSLFIYRGVALLMTEGYSIPIPTEGILPFIGRGYFLGLPMPVILAAVVVIAGYVVFNHTRFGRATTGIGSNREGVRRAGVNVRRVTVMIYVWTGIIAAFAGLILTSRLGSGSANQGVMFELDVVAAVVLGSTSLFGGKGTIIGTLFGALAISMIQNGLILAHISPYFTQIATGLIIIAAIWFNTWLLGRPINRAH